MKTPKISNVMLCISVAMIVSYTVVAIVLQFETSIELSPTLTERWYTFWTAEIFALAGIKIVKVRSPSTDETPVTPPDDFSQAG